MNQNSLIEVGSKADIIFRFKGEITVNGRNYKANEPYLVLKDANIIINYAKNDRVGTTEKNVIANSEIKPRSVSIGGIPFTRKLAALMACYKGEVEYYPTLSRTLTAERTPLDEFGYIFLVDNIKVNEKLFVFNDEFNLVEDVIYDETLNALKSINFENSKDYYISFSSVKTGTKFDLNKPSIPYLSMEIQAKGNIDKITADVFMYFDKVSLNTLIQFNFIQRDMISVPLEFHIIDDKNNYIIFGD